MVGFVAVLDLEILRLVSFFCLKDPFYARDLSRHETAPVQSFTEV